MPEKPTDRAATRLAWARRAMGNPAITLESASSDASFRSYWRTRGQAPSRVVMDAPPAVEDIRPWVRIGQQLAAAGIRVPTVYASDPQQGFALIDDFGATLYLDVLNAGNADVLYADAMQVLVCMQTRVFAKDLAPYDARFLHAELDLMRPWFLEAHLGCILDTAASVVLEQAFEILVNNALQQPQCFVHRDFHSRNLMMLPDTGDTGVIDFQGALRGPLTYDLVSLLRDCYVRWDEGRVDAWREDYRRRLLDHGALDADIDAATFRRWFDLTGLQRHLKVLGIFCRLARRDGKAGYLRDLPRVFAHVMTVANRYTELSTLAELLDAATRGRDLTQAAPDTEATSCVL